MNIVITQIKSLVLRIKLILRGLFCLHAFLFSPLSFAAFVEPTSYSLYGQSDQFTDQNFYWQLYQLEEINLDLSKQHVIGTLDDYVTRSGYVITPVVVWADVIENDLKPNPGEVASIHAFTFTELARGDSPNLESIPQSDRQVLSMNYHDDVVYAPTAAMLYQFREVAINGNATKVLDYDQPVFAWR